MIGELIELVEVVAAIDDAGIDKGRGPARGEFRSILFRFLCHRANCTENKREGKKKA